MLQNLDHIIIKVYISENIDFIDSSNEKKSEFLSVFFKNSFKESERTKIFNKSENKESVKTDPNITASVSSSPTVSCYTKNKLKDLYPLDEKQVSELNYKSSREFSVNFVNELLLKLDSKYPLRTFSNKKQIMNYLSKALQYEKHQEPVVNHESFKFASYDPDEQKKDKMDKYLAAVEANLNTNAAHLN